MDLNMEKKMIYEEMCTLLTDYEHKDEIEMCSTDDINWADELYYMLVKIQNRWEDTITAQEQ